MTGYTALPWEKMAKSGWQPKAVWHVSNLHHIDEQERLGARLCAASFADKVFFANSGAEAVEASIKAARRHHFTNGAPERYRLLCERSPELIERLTQKDIARYLGITPVALSRIRARAGDAAQGSDAG